MKDKLPLPSVCACCRTTIHAIFGRHYDSHGSSSRVLAVSWFHDAPLAVIMRRGGIHDATPDPSYQPQRGRVVDLIPESAVEVTRAWRVTTMAA